jgi:phosphoribosyl 1,2-cyclic phosphate phosphodiesterase
MRLQVTRENITEIEGVLITHTHADHVMGMDDLRSICIRTRRHMPIYTLPQYQADIRRIYAYAFGDYPPGVEVPRFDLRDLPEVLEVGGMRIQTFLVKHGSIPVVAFRVGGFAYVTDVSEIPPEAEPFLRDLDVLVVDAVRYKPHVNHFHYEKALDVIAELAPQKAYLTHLGHDYDHDKTNEALPDGVELAYDRLRIPIRL